MHRTKKKKLDANVRMQEEKQHPARKEQNDNSYDTITENIDDSSFPSAGLLLDIARDEYAKERERSQILDNKASFFMSAIILMITIFIPFIPIQEICAVIVEGTKKQNSITCAFGTLTIVSFVLLAYAFKKLYDAYRIKGYERFNIENLVDLNNLRTDRNIMEKSLCENYKNTVEKNIDKNEDKANKVANGIKLCSIGFLLLALSAIVLVCVVGQKRL